MLFMQHRSETSAERRQTALHCTGLYISRLNRTQPPPRPCTHKEVREEERFCVRFCSLRFERWVSSAECSCNGEMLFFRPSFWRRCMPCWIVSENCIPRRELETWWAFSTVANARGENGFEIQWCLYSDNFPFLTEKSVLELWIAVADVALWRASAAAEPLKGESKLGICTCRIRILLFTKLCFEVWNVEVRFQWKRV
jgi:hypothetical protein